MINEKLLKEAPIYTMKNEKFIEESESCGCYSCLSTFSKHDIINWTDDGKTAICPVCHVDSVLADTYGIPLDKEHLKIVHDYWLI
jgi:hypothetical protein